MPEGHTLHRVAAELRDRFAGRIVTSSSPQGRFILGAARVDGHRLVDAEAWGKHVLVRFDGVAEQVHVHLGLFGRWTITVSEDVAAVVGEVRWRLRSESVVAELRGPTACELLTPREVAALLARLGPDPLRDDADPDRAWQRISASRAPLATLLMDQAVVAGIGNVYRAEVLFRTGCRPDLPGRDLDRPTWDAIWADLVRPHARRRPLGPDRHRPRRAHAGGDGTRAARRCPRRRGLRLPPHRACRAWCAARPFSPRSWQAEICSGARNARAPIGSEGEYEGAQRTGDARCLHPQDRAGVAARDAARPGLRDGRPGRDHGGHLRRLAGELQRRSRRVVRPSAAARQHRPALPAAAPARRRRGRVRRCHGHEARR